MPKNQTVPGSIGAAISVIWMVYGEWWGLIPTDLGQTQELALTGAVGILGAAVVNLIMRFIPAKVATPASTTNPDNPERREP